MADDDIILSSDIDPIRSTAITDDILTLVTVASGVSTLHMVDLRNNVSGQENTVVTTIEISGASIQGATSQIFYPINKINSEYLIQGRISNVISSSYGIDGQIISARISSEYSIRNKISNVTSSEYSIKNKISKTISSEYSIQNIISKTISSEYSIQSRLTKTYNSQYSIDSIILNTTPSSYSIQNIISNVISSEYSIQSRISKIYNSQYNIDGIISNTTTSKYSIQNIITNVISSSYNILHLAGRLLLHNNNTNEIIAYTIQNRNSYIADDNYNFTYPINVTGIAGEEKSIWSVLTTGTTARKYNRNGILEQTVNLDAANNPEQGLAWYDNKLYAINAGSTRSVYVYDTTDNSAVLNFTIGNVGNPRSVIVYKGIIYIATLTPGKLYAFDQSGTRMEDKDIMLPADVDPIRSTAITDDILTLVTVASGNSTLHMVDLKNNVSGQENTVIATREISGTSIQGATSQIFYPIQKINSEYSIKNKISKTISSEYLIQGRISNIYNSSYVISNALFFSTSDSISAYGLTFGGGYYWQLGFGGTVYAYNTDGTRSSENDFDLDDDNSIPGGITYHDNKFWVVDTRDDKVYVYNTDGSRASENDFDLDGDSNRANGITYHDNKFWIVDTDNNKVYVYNVDGSRASTNDFDLDDDNSIPGGITYHDNKFWIVDFGMIKYTSTIQMATVHQRMILIYMMKIHHQMELHIIMVDY